MLVFVVLKCPDNNVKYIKVAYRHGTQFRICIRPATARTLEHSNGVRIVLCSSVCIHIFMPRVAQLYV